MGWGNGCKHLSQASRVFLTAVAFSPGLFVAFLFGEPRLIPCPFEDRQRRRHSSGKWCERRQPIHCCPQSQAAMLLTFRWRTRGRLGPLLPRQLPGFRVSRDGRSGTFQQTFMCREPTRATCEGHFVFPFRTFSRRWWTFRHVMTFSRPFLWFSERGLEDRG